MGNKKKAKARTKATPKRTAKEKAETAKAKKGKDIVEVRKSIDTLVVDSAQEIALGVITVAKSGQLAPAKYLFEAVGLYPPTEQTAAPVPLKDTLAHTLLTRMGIPTEPVNHGEDDESDTVLTSNGVKAPAAPSSAENEAGDEREDEQPSAPTDGEQ